MALKIYFLKLNMHGLFLAFDSRLSGFVELNMAFVEFMM
jgi:hypothetical protein